MIENCFDLFSQPGLYFPGEIKGEIYRLTSWIHFIIMLLKMNLDNVNNR